MPFVQKNIQRYKCQQCGKRFSDHKKKRFGTDVRLPKEQIVTILPCLVEGNSVRSTARLCDVELKTVLSMLKLAGKNCERIMGKLIVNVPVKDVRCDEIRGFVAKKEGHNLPAEANDESIGEAYCFVAVDRITKLVLNLLRAAVVKLHGCVCRRSSRRDRAATVPNQHTRISALHFGNHDHA